MNNFPCELMHEICRFTYATKYDVYILSLLSTYNFSVHYKSCKRLIKTNKFNISEFTKNYAFNKLVLYLKIPYNNIYCANVAINGFFDLINCQFVRGCPEIYFFNDNLFHWNSQLSCNYLDNCQCYKCAEDLIYANKKVKCSPYRWKLSQEYLLARIYMNIP
jgi:hypothetical protein